MTTTSGLEIEIKIQLESFTDYLKLLGYLGPIDREEHHLNAFFDSPERDLGRAGYVLRVRSTDQYGSVTLKSFVSQADALAVRQEVTGEISSTEARAIIDGRADLMALDIEPIATIRQQLPDLRPSLILQFRNERHIKRHRIGDHDLNLEIDRTEFADGSTEYELEVELDDRSHFDTVYSGLERLFQLLAIPLIAQSKSKFERALARG
ncbi:MAG: CYTH domain-containing protein [Candidatus Zixiibacteriota bacterium]